LAAVLSDNPNTLTVGWAKIHPKDIRKGVKKEMTRHIALARAEAGHCGATLPDCLKEPIVEFAERLAAKLGIQHHKVLMLGWDDTGSASLPFCQAEVTR